KSLMLSIALGGGALGLLGATPGKAQAQWPNYFTRGYRVGPNGSMQVISWPLYSTSVSPFGPAWGYSRQWLSAPGYMTSFTPFSPLSVWASGGSATFNYSPWWGPMWQVNTPSYVGWNFTPFSGFRSIAIPSSTIISGLNGSVAIPNMSTWNGTWNWGNSWA